MRIAVVMLVFLTFVSGVMLGAAVSDGTCTALRAVLGDQP